MPRRMRGSTMSDEQMYEELTDPDAMLRIRDVEEVVRERVADNYKG